MTEYIWDPDQMVRPEPVQPRAGGMPAVQEPVVPPNTIWDPDAMSVDPSMLREDKSSGKLLYAPKAEPEKPRTTAQIFGLGDTYGPVPQFIHGGTLGLSDFGRGYVRDVVRGYPWGTGSEQIARDREAYQNKYPTESLGMEIAGGLTTPMGLARIPIQGVKTIPNTALRVGAQTATGVGIGGVMGGVSKGLDELPIGGRDAAIDAALGGALTGGALGGVLGAAPGALELTKGVGRYLRPAVMPESTAGRNLAGTTGQVFPPGADIENVTAALTAREAALNTSQTNLAQAQKAVDNSLDSLKLAVKNIVPGMPAQIASEGLLGNSFVRSLEGSPISQKAVDDFIAKQGNNLDQHPEFVQKLRDTAKAQEAVNTQQAAHMAEYAGFQTGVASKLLGGADVQTQIGKVFGGENAPGAMRQLFKNMAGNADGEAGLARGIAQHLSNEFVDPQSGRLDTAGLAKYVVNNRRTLEAGLSKEGMETLNRLARGFGDTSRGEGKGYIVPTIIGALTGTGMGGAGTAGLAVSELLSGNLAMAGGLAAGATGAMIGGAVKALRDRGLDTADKILGRALTDPEFGNQLARRATKANLDNLVKSLGRGVKNVQFGAVPAAAAATGAADLSQNLTPLPTLGAPMLGPILPPF